MRATERKSVDLCYHLEVSAMEERDQSESIETSGVIDGNLV